MRQMRLHQRQREEYPRAEEEDGECCCDKQGSADV